MKTLVASDLDGTWTEYPEVRSEAKFLVTGNSWDQYEAYDIDMPIFWNPGKEEVMDIVHHKANIINQTGVTKFFEDQEIQVKLLKTLCPKCEIVLVTPEVFA